jgi:hypothetical protein
VKGSEAGESRTEADILGPRGDLAKRADGVSVTIDQRVRTTQPSAGSRRALRTVFRLCPMSVCAYLALTSAPLAAQTPTLPSVENADLQKWDELDVLTRLSPNLDVTWMTQVRFSSELPNPVIYVVGTDWNVSIGKLLVITPSYYYFAFRTLSGAKGHAHSPILAVTPTFTRGRFTVSDRNRFVAVIGTTGLGKLWILGNRPRIDCRIGPSRWHMSLFIWDEVFYVSTFDDWTRNRAAVGVRKTLGNRLVVNIYYQRQDDAHSRPQHLTSIGALFELRIH